MRSHAAEDRHLSEAEGMRGMKEVNASEVKRNREDEVEEPHKKTVREAN